MNDVVKLNHIRFLSDDKPVCHWPARLGTDFVYNTDLKKDEERHCKECSQLVLAHNVKESLAENHPPMVISPAEHSCFRGIMYGLLFCSLFWAAIIVLFIAF